MTNKPKWTPAQQLAISTKGKTLLISAAAGSGKTATLTERIIRSVTDKDSPADISKMLVVTFTVDAASELKQRISRALSKEIAMDPASKHLSKQIILLESAQISTIDSFLFNVVKENFQRLDLPTGLRIGNEGELFLLEKTVLEDLIDERYDEQGEDGGAFISFVENFIDTKESTPLSLTLLNLYNSLSSRVEGIDYIKACADELVSSADGEFFESRSGKCIYDYLNEGFSYFKSSFEKAVPLVSEELIINTVCADLDFLKKAEATLSKKNYSLARETILSFPKGNLKGKTAALKSANPHAAATVQLREDFISFWEKAKNLYLAIDADAVSDSLKESAQILFSLYELMAEFQRRAIAEKYKQKLFSFNDITRFALQILSNDDGDPSDVARSYREKFDDIYIDEYQDISPIQDLIFNLISKSNNKFMVGDIKQSIYCFRNADPEIFSKYKKSFPLIDPDEPTLPSSDVASIFMSNNFRCDENIIKFTNAVFSYIFGFCGESIGYTLDDELRFSKREEGRTMPSPSVKVRAIYKQKLPRGDALSDDSLDEHSDISKEAIWVANEIHRLISEEKNANGKPIQPRDIAILVRKGNAMSDFERALSALRIPVLKKAKSKSIFETPDIMLMLSLLSAINNPQRDITLAATLYSPFFAYTMDDLILIRDSADGASSLFEALVGYESTDDARIELVQKNKRFLEKLSLYRNFAYSSQIDRLIDFIYNDLSLMSASYANTENLLALYELARSFESGSFKGLNNFISYVNDLIENKKAPDGTEKEDESANAVRIMTMHKSKGLEFPVCFVSSTQSRFTFKDTEPPIIYSSGAGIGFSLSHKSGFAKIDTPLRESVIQKIKADQKEEEMRLLYVALTRARERLYVTASSFGNTNLETVIGKAQETSVFSGAFALKEASSHLEYVLAALYPFSEDPAYSVEFVNSAEIKLKDVYESSAEALSSAKIDLDRLSELRKRIEFKYPHEYLSRLPAKLSVSKLTPTVLDDVDNNSLSLGGADSSRIIEISEFFEGKASSSSADRGTATHLFLQFCDFENASKNGVEAELSRLVEKRFISEKVARLINKDQLDRFFKSRFFSILSNSTDLYREQRFNILLPASHFTDDQAFEKQTEDEKILVQGVIDLFFTAADESLILCDYKTDYLTPEERQSAPLAAKKLKEKHGEQLSYYSMAIERMCGRKPDKIFIYSLPFGEAIEIQ